jgi:hypothetical protein
MEARVKREWLMGDERLHHKVRLGRVLSTEFLRYRTTAALWTSCFVLTWFWVGGYSLRDLSTGSRDLIAGFLPGWRSARMNAQQ